MTAVAGALAAAAACGGSLLVVTRPVSGEPDAIVMLASHEWERLPAAAALARQYPSSDVLLTVPRAISDLNCHRCGERAQMLVAAGVPAARIHVLPDTTRNTYDEATAVLVHWQRARFTRLAVVTSPYHARRSLATFREVFKGLPVEVGVYPAASASAAPGRWWLRYDDVRYVMYEWAAVAYYRLKYGVPLLVSAVPGGRNLESGRWKTTRESGPFTILQHEGSLALLDPVTRVGRIPPLVAEAEQEDPQHAKQLRREYGGHDVDAGLQASKAAAGGGRGDKAAKGPENDGPEAPRFPSARLQSAGRETSRFRAENRRTQEVERFCPGKLLSRC